MLNSVCIVVIRDAQLSGPFVGCSAASPSLPRNAAKEGALLWEQCDAMVALAESGKLASKK